MTCKPEERDRLRQRAFEIDELGARERNFLKRKLLRKLARSYLRASREGLPAPTIRNIVALYLLGLSVCLAALSLALKMFLEQVPIAFADIVSLGVLSALNESEGIWECAIAIAIVGIAASWLRAMYLDFIN